MTFRQYLATMDLRNGLLGAIDKDTTSPSIVCGCVPNCLWQAFWGDSAAMLGNFMDQVNGFSTPRM